MKKVSKKTSKAASLLRTSSGEDAQSKEQRSEAAAVVGRLGGLKRGRWKNMTEKEKSAAARKIASAKRKKTPEEREAARKANSERMKKYWADLDEESKRRHLKRMSRSHNRRRQRRTITVDAVREIRAAFDSGVPQKPLAEKYGISVQQVSNIVRRRSWKNV